MFISFWLFSWNSGKRVRVSNFLNNNYFFGIVLLISLIIHVLNIIIFYSDFFSHNSHVLLLVTFHMSSCGFFSFTLFLIYFYFILTLFSSQHFSYFGHIPKKFPHVTRVLFRFLQLISAGQHLDFISTFSNEAKHQTVTFLIDVFDEAQFNNMAIQSAFQIHYNH